MVASRKKTTTAKQKKTKPVKKKPKENKEKTEETKEKPQELLLVRLYEKRKKFREAYYNNLNNKGGKK